MTENQTKRRRLPLSFFKADKFGFDKNGEVPGTSYSCMTDDDAAMEEIANATGIGTDRLYEYALYAQKCREETNDD